MIYSEMIIINILYEDKYMIACVKPVGVLSEDEGMPILLKDELGGNFYCVHRLDRAVGGVMIYAKTKASAGKLTELISSKAVTKEYLAVIHGSMDENAGTLTDLLFKDSAKNKSYVVSRMRKGVKEATLEYEVLDKKADTSLLKIRLHTGRSHQIRVQFSSRKHPLIGDVKYGSTDKSCNIALFSHSLSFTHPFTGKELRFSAFPDAAYPWDLYADTLK